MNKPRQRDNQRKWNYPCKQLDVCRTKMKRKEILSECMILAKELKIEVKPSFSRRSFRVNKEVVVYSLKDLLTYLRKEKQKVKAKQQKLF